MTADNLKVQPQDDAGGPSTIKTHHWSPQKHRLRSYIKPALGVTKWPKNKSPKSVNHTM